MQINPIIIKDLKTKMRGWKAPALITVYLAFLGFIVLFVFITTGVSSRYGYGAFNPRTAMNAYYVLAVVQLGLIMFIVPVMTGGAISNERERQTLDLLLCTNLPTQSIVIGKLVVSIAHILLLVTASLPVMAVVFLFGGVGLGDLLALFGFYLVTALFVGSLGIFYSTVFRKSVISIIVTYITLGILTIGTIIAFALWWQLIYDPYHGPHTPTVVSAMLFFFPNPLYGFGSIITEVDIVGNMFRSFNPSSINLLNAIKPWMLNVFFDVTASVGLILLSAWRIKPGRK